MFKEGGRTGDNTCKNQVTNSGIRKCTAGRGAVRGADRPCSGVTKALAQHCGAISGHLTLDVDVKDMARLEAEGSAKAKVGLTAPSITQTSGS